MPSPSPRALVLGGYGLIGASAMRALSEAGFDVTGVGRSLAAARLVLPQARWEIADLTRLEATDWAQLCAGYDVVVNAAGALQDGGGDDLCAIHEDMLRHLLAGVQGRDVRLVQISAAGVSPEASTEFFRSKARGDALIRASGVAHVILRPTLVLGQAAYGGTALLRAAAALPLVDWQMLPEARIQTVALADLNRAIVAAARGEVPAGTVADITEAESRPFPELVQDMRAWLGVPTPKLRLPLPGFALRLIDLGADLLAGLGWKSPLRSTALRALADGITGDPTDWEKAGGPACRSLQEVLANTPATVQERWFARSYLLLPLILATLALFWLASGLIGFWQFEAAQQVLTNRGMGSGAAGMNVAVGIGLDLLLGTLVLFRRWVKVACLGMVAVTLGYLAAGTLLAPDLWMDPLGPFVKTLPAAVLALVPLALMGNR